MPCLTNLKSIMGRVVLLAVVVVMLAACRHMPAVETDNEEGLMTRSDRVNVRQVAKLAHCEYFGEQPVWRTMEEADAFDDTLSHLTTGVDFSFEEVLVIYQGLQPTMGYGVELLSSTAPVIVDEAVIRVRLVRPSPGMIVGQALSSPCLVLAVRGQFESIVIVDQYDRHVPRRQAL